LTERTKFNVDKDKDKRTHNNIIFDSVMEMKYYRDVILPQMESGDIVDCELQKTYELQPKFKHDEKTVLPIKYVADFVVTYSNGSIEVIDTKGCPDSVALIKRKLFWYVYPNVIYKWICYSKIDGGWCDYEYVKVQRKIRKKQRANK
jgi:Protein of unknown function (DUF1064).